MSMAAPTATAPPASRGRLAGDEGLLRLLRTDPVSRHTRILLWVLAGLAVVAEVVLFVLEPTLLEWTLAEPAVQAEIDAGLAPPEMNPREGLGLAVRIGIAAFGVLATLLFAWQPSIAAVVVLGASAVLLGGLVGPDSQQLTPTSLAALWVLGGAMVVRYSHRGFVWLALAAAMAVTVAGELLAGPPTEGMPDPHGVHAVTLVLAVLAAVPAYLVRRARHRTRDRMAALAAQEERVRQAAEAERQRIAVELHDVVAHGLTVISMQAAMLPTLTDADRRRGAEEAIETAARQSLVDLRRMLTALRGTSRNEDTQDPDAVADLPGRLAELQARLRGAGYAVDGEFAGLDLLPESMRLTVLRIAQEATTNVLKHGPGTGRVCLCTRVDEDARVTVRVESPLAPPRPEPERGPGGRGTGAGPRRAFPSSGFGLAGMAERVSLFGGTITAGARDGRWVVDAVLPTR